MIAMTKIINILLVGIILTGNYSCVRNDTSPNKIVYYYREERNTNEYKSYHDYLVIENYINKSFTYKDLARIATTYIDTVKTKVPVSGVTFVRKYSNEKLPPGNWDSFQEQKKYFIVSIRLSGKEPNKDRNVEFMTVWKNGTPLPFPENNQIDSLLRDSILIDANLD
jgi:hypothetical protein